MKSNYLRRYRLGISVVVSFFFFVGCGPSQAEYTAKVTESARHEKLAAERLQTVEKLITSKSDLEAGLKKKDQDLRQLNQKRQQLQKDKAQLEEDLKAAHQENQRLHQESEANQSSIQAKRTEVDQMIEDVAQSRKDMDDQLNMAHQANIRLKAQLSENEKQIAVLTIEQENLRRKLRQSYGIVEEREEVMDSYFVEARQSTQRMKSQLSSQLNKEIKSGDVQVIDQNDHLIVRLQNRRIFNPSQSFISASGFKLLKTVGISMKQLNHVQIQVAAHTDNRKIGQITRKKFPTNWELSAARAVSVVRYLVDEVKIPPNRIAATGYGPHQPIASNSSIKGREQNRRVEFILRPTQ